MSLSNRNGGQNAPEADKCNVFEIGENPLFKTSSSDSLNATVLGTRRSTILPGVKCCECCYPDPATERGKRYFTVNLLLITVIPILILLGFNGWLLYISLKKVDQAVKLKREVMLGLPVLHFRHSMQLERGEVVLHVSNFSRRYSKLQMRYRETDKALTKVKQLIENDETMEYFKMLNYEYIMRSLRDIRSKTRRQELTMAEVTKMYTAITNETNEILKIRNKEIETDLWKELESEKKVSYSNDHAALEKESGIKFYIKGGFSLKEFLYHNSQKVISEDHLRLSQLDLPLVSDYLDKKFTNTSTARSLERMRAEISVNQSTDSARQWLNTMAVYMQVLNKLQLFLKNITIQKVKEIENISRIPAIFNIFIIIVVLMLLPLQAYRVYWLTNSLQLYSTCLQMQAQKLEKERHRSEKILLEFLPGSIAQALIQKETVYPEQFESVTILFSDVVDFTAISSNSTPMEVITMINMIFCEFDDTVKCYDVYRMAIIGDAYMVISGLPVRNGIRHATEIANFALHLVDSIPQLKIPHMPLENLKLRVGINTGPVVGGIVGDMMPFYTVFGDTVNIASRMESTGLPGRIQISQSTHNLLQDYDYIFEKRGFIYIKGKGEMETYWLLGKYAENKSKCCIESYSKSSINTQDS